MSYFHSYALIAPAAHTKAKAHSINVKPLLRSLSLTTSVFGQMAALYLDISEMVKVNDHLRKQ